MRKWKEEQWDHCINRTLSNKDNYDHDIFYTLDCLAPKLIAQNIKDSCIQQFSENSAIEFAKLLLKVTSVSNDALGEALINASINNDLEFLKLLLEHHCDINSTYGEEAFSEAIEQGDLKIVSTLLQQGIDVLGKYGGEELKAASEEGHHEIVQILVDYGVDVSKYGSAALTAAILGNHRKVVTLLFENNADLNSACDGGALVIASRLGKRKMVKTLLDCNIHMI